jgi:hypothetical protein
MKISTRQLSSIIQEAIESPVDLDSMSDKDIEDLINKAKQKLQQRAAQAKRNSFTSVQQAALYLQNVAIGDLIYDDDKVDGALEFITQKSDTPPGISVRKRRVEKLSALVGDMSNLAYEMNMGHSDYESFDDDEREQNRNIKKLEQIMTSLGVKFDKKGFVTK